MKYLLLNLLLTSAALANEPSQVPTLPQVAVKPSCECHVCLCKKCVCEGKECACLNCDTTYAAVYARVLKGEPVTANLKDIPGFPAGKYKCWLENGQPVFKQVEVGKAAVPFTQGTPVPRAGRASTGSPGGTGTARTITPARGAALSGGTAAGCSASG